MGEEQELRGGLRYTPMVRSKEGKDEGTTGYGPGGGLHRGTMFWIYNCQMMNNTRAREWSEELRGAIVMMQGTQATYEPTKGERSLQQWATAYHDVWEYKKQKRRGAGCQPEGVAVLAPKGMKELRAAKGKG